LTKIVKIPTLAKSLLIHNFYINNHFLEMNKFERLAGLIGRTPLLKINYSFHGKRRCVFAKAEYFNLTGSIKDRMAVHILKEAYAGGAIREGDTIVEATSGNTGISFAALGAYLGNPVVIYMPDWMSAERKSIISSFGAKIQLVSREEGGFVGSISKAEELGRNTRNVFLSRQFDNRNNIIAHVLTTAPEIWRQLESVGLSPDIAVAGVGTGGTVMGLCEYFKSRRNDITVHPLEPLSSPTLTRGCCVGRHRIQGISDDFIPSIMDMNRLDRVVSVDDGDSIIMAQMLARKLGLGVGISSGSNLIGAIMLKEQNPDATVVTVFADDNKKYISTDYGKNEPEKEEFISSSVELLDFETIAAK